LRSLLKRENEDCPRITQKAEAACCTNAAYLGKKEKYIPKEERGP